MTSRHDELSHYFPHATRFAVRTSGAGAGLLGLVLIIGVFWPRAAMRSYLFAYVFWLNVSLGALGWLALSHVTGGAWGRTIRRAAEAMAGALPVLAALGVPLVLGASHLYAWADAGIWENDPVLLHRRPWISLTWVAARAGVAFAVWIAIAVSLRRLSLAQDGERSGQRLLSLGHRQRAVSTLAVPALFVSVFLLSVDWLMALEPHWISSIFGLVVLMGQATTAIAAVVLLLFALERTSGRPFVPADRAHDLGKLLLTSLVLWAYMSFAQYLIQWMGHTQEDIAWYRHRLHGGWAWVAGALCVLHLGVPLVLLLSRPLKRHLGALAVVAAWVFAMRVVDVLWTIAPTGPRGEAGGVYVTDPLAWLGVGGVWGGMVVWQASHAPLRPTAYLTSGANVSGIVVEGAVDAD